MPLVVGVDSSTQSTKVEVRDADDGALVATGRAPHPATAPPRSEQHPDAWWDALQQALGQALSAAGASGYDAIAVAGQQHGMVVLDAHGAVVRPAKLWNDTESAPDAQWLVQQLGGPEAWAQGCGSVPVASFTITKLSWLHRSEPEHFARLAHVMLPHDWLTWRLTGARVTDRGDASGTGYWSPAEERWRPDLLEIVSADVDWVAALPQVLAPTAAVPGRSGGVVAPGTGDNMAAALGVGLQEGSALVSLGTSGTVCARSARPVADPRGEVAGFADATGRFLPLVCTLNATKVTEAIARLLQVDLGTLDAMARDHRPGAGGVVVVPYFDGERTPNRPGATGSISGLRTTTEAADLARAAFEGVVCGLLDGLDALRRVGVATGGELVLVGGGARSAAYRRILADLSGRPVRVPPGDEHAALGAAVQAAAALAGAEPDAVRAAWSLPADAVTDPDPSVDADAVRAAYARAAARAAD